MYTSILLKYDKTYREIIISKVKCLKKIMTICIINIFKLLLKQQDFY